MKNLINTIKFKIKNWLVNRGYNVIHIFVVDVIYAHVSRKISPQDLKDFKKEFGNELILDGASFNEKGESNEFIYYCKNNEIDNYYFILKKWLNNHKYPLRMLMLSSDISLKCSEKLSDKQIHDFEDKFNVKLINYSINCNSNELNYNFSY